MGTHILLGLRNWFPQRPLYGVGRRRLAEVVSKTDRQAVSAEGSLRDSPKKASSEQGLNTERDDHPRNGEADGRTRPRWPGPASWS